MISNEYVSVPTNFPPLDGLTCRERKYYCDRKIPKFDRLSHHQEHQNTRTPKKNFRAYSTSCLDENDEYNLELTCPILKICCAGKFLANQASSQGFYLFHYAVLSPADEKLSVNCSSMMNFSSQEVYLNKTRNTWVYHPPLPSANTVHYALCVCTVPSVYTPAHGTHCTKRHPPTTTSPY